MPRKSKIELHPDISRIIEQVINGEMSKRRASEIVGTTEQNFNQWFNRRYKKAPQRIGKPKKKRPIVSEPQQDPTLLIRLLGAQTNEEWGSAAWKGMLQNLTSTLQDEALDVNDQIKLANVLLKLLQFQFKEKDSIPEYQEKELVLNAKQEEELLNRILKDHDEWCPYRREAIKIKARKQTEIRFLSPESSSLG